MLFQSVIIKTQEHILFSLIIISHSATNSSVNNGKEILYVIAQVAINTNLYRQSLVHLRTK